MGMKIYAPATLEDFAFSMLPQDDDEPMSKSRVSSPFLSKRTGCCTERQWQCWSEKKVKLKMNKIPAKLKYAIPSSMKLWTKFPRNWMVPSRTWSFCRSVRSHTGL